MLERAVAIGTIYSEDVSGQDVGAIVPLSSGVISHGANGRPLDRKILENPNVSGFLVLQDWNDIKPVEGVFNWKHIDSEVARAKAAGKVIKLTIHAGGDSAPAWIFENYPQVKRIFWYDKVMGKPQTIEK